MDLFLFCVFVAISLILIGLGLFRADHTELPLVGFLFLFLLAMTILTGSVQYKIGTETNTTYSYVVNDTINMTQEVSYDVYDDINLDGSLTAKLVGYWLAIMSIVGFIGVLVGLGRTKWRNSD